MWQTVERKAAFIHQVMAGTIDGRDVEDIGDVALSYAEVKALASGNPLILEKAGVDNEVAKLNRLKQAHFRDQASLKRTLSDTQAEIPRLERLIDHIDQALPRRIDTSHDKFRMTVNRTTTTKRVDAGKQLLDTIGDRLLQARQGAAVPAAVVVELAGFPLHVAARADWVSVSLVGTPVQVGMTPDVYSLADPQGIIVRLENRIRGMEEFQEQARDQLTRIRREAAAAQDRIGRPFDLEPRLHMLLQRQKLIEEELKPKEPEQPVADTAGITPPALSGSVDRSAPPSRQVNPYDIRRSLAATKEGVMAEGPDRPLPPPPIRPQHYRR